MSCNKEGGCVVSKSVQKTHGVESCGDRSVVDVKPVRKAGVKKSTESDKS